MPCTPSDKRLFSRVHVSHFVELPVSLDSSTMSLRCFAVWGPFLTLVEDLLVAGRVFFPVFVVTAVVLGEGRWSFAFLGAETQHADREVAKELAALRVPFPTLLCTFFIPFPYRNVNQKPTHRVRC